VRLSGGDCVAGCVVCGEILNGVITYSRTLECEQVGLRVFYMRSKNFEGILT
jgi:hypothetical protein